MIAFLLNPLTKLVGVVIVVGGALWGVYHAGGSAARSECNADALRSEIVQLKEEIAKAKRAEEDAAQRAELMDRLAGLNAEKRDELAALVEQRNATPPEKVVVEVPVMVPVDGKCPAPPARQAPRDSGLSDDDARRLRSIKGR